MTLEQVLADWREEATILRRAGHADEADLRERMARQVQDAAPDYLEWVMESDAMAISGRSAEFFRTRFPTWERDGHALRLLLRIDGWQHPVLSGQFFDNGSGWIRNEQQYIAGYPATAAHIFRQVQRWHDATFRSLHLPPFPFGDSL